MPFSVKNGQFIDPSGNPFIGRGVNVYNLHDAITKNNKITSDLSPLTDLFPNIGFIRLNIGKHQYPSVESLKPYIDACIKGGICVAIEDHLFPQSDPVKDTTQAAQSAWYASFARAYINEPMLWFMTTNEPTSADGQSRIPVMNNHVAIYKAIRDTGNKTIILFDPFSGGGPGRQGTSGGFDASRYANMFNVGWDLHVYSWYFGNRTTDLALIKRTIAQYAQQCHDIRSLDGPMPVHLGEYGDSTDGNNIDSNWKQVLQATHEAGYGTAAWNYDRLTPNPGDVLQDNGRLTAYGQIVSAHVRAGQKASVGPAIPPPPVKSESNEGVTVTGPSSAPIINVEGLEWLINSDRKITVNGVVDDTTNSVVKMVYTNHRVSQTNERGGIWSKARQFDGWRQDKAENQTPTKSDDWGLGNYRGMPYHVRFPVGYAASTAKFPVVLFLHQLDNHAAMPGQVNPWLNTSAFRSAHPAIIIVPQCKINNQTSGDGSSMNWGGVTPQRQQSIAYVIEILKICLAAYKADPDRVYVTGNSMGGLGTWGLMCDPELEPMFAAAMPLAGACYYHLNDAAAMAQRLRSKPIWAIHGVRDTQVRPQFDQAFAAATRAIGGVPKYSELQMDHDVWDNEYPKMMYWDWMFQQKKSSSQPPPSQFTESAHLATITKPSDPAIVNSVGEKWTITAEFTNEFTTEFTPSMVAVNGTADTTTANVKQIVYSRSTNPGRVYQQNKALNWWFKSRKSDQWTAGSAPQ